MKLFLENLNSDPYPPYSINTYTYNYRVYDDYKNSITPAIIIFLDVGRLVLY